jgi:hypothetical protein
LASTQEIVVIFNSGSVVGGSSELVGIITKESALTGQEVGVVQLSSVDVVVGGRVSNQTLELTS